VRAAGRELLVILGSNGAGKSTTMRAIIGTVKCAERALSLEGRPLGGLQAWQLPHHGVVLVPDGARCFPNLSVQENLHGAFVALNGPGTGDREEKLVAGVHALFPILKTKAGAPAGTLSGGQRQMLALGRALMAEPKVLLLDEPSSGLAPKIVEELFEALAQIKAQQDVAVVMAEQNVGYAMRIADNCLVLEEGTVVLSGSIADVIKNERLRTAYLGL
jgi:branched-chain amino acid transport system ATP-binding protein